MCPSITWKEPSDMVPCITPSSVNNNWAFSDTLGSLLSGAVRTTTIIKHGELSKNSGRLKTFTFCSKALHLRRYQRSLLRLWLLMIFTLNFRDSFFKGICGCLVLQFSSNVNSCSRMTQHKIRSILYPFCHAFQERFFFAKWRHSSYNFQYRWRENSLIWYNH